MANGKNDWRTGPEANQLRREFREEAIKLRNEMRDEFQRKMAEQMAQMATQERGPHHRGPRGRRASLSREAIVDTAMRIMNTKGLDKVTMRSIAHELNTGPASIYVHVRSVVELHGFMLDHLFSSLDLTDHGDDWRTELKRILHDSMAVLAEHPELARSAVTVHPVGDGSFGVFDRLLALLAQGGIARDRAAWGADILLLHVMATAAEHTADDEDHAIEAFQKQLAGGQYPHISAAEDVLFTGSDTVRIEWAIDALLNGIAQTPVPAIP
jgi:AcrR family transcriptional regulator